MNLKYKTYYSLAGKQMLSSGGKIIAWTAFWCLLQGLLLLGPALFIYSEAVKVSLGVDGGEALQSFTAILQAISGYGFLTAVVLFIFEAFRNYSFFGISYYTSDDINGSWLEVGLSGFLHPFRALGVSFAIQIVSWLLGILGFIIAFFIAISTSSAASGVTFVILYFVAYGYVLLGFMTSWFQMYDNPSLGGFGAIKASFAFMKGKRTMSFLVLLPVAAAIVLCLCISANSFYKKYQVELIELSLATEAIAAINENQVAEEAPKFNIANDDTFTDDEKNAIRIARSFGVYTAPVPEYHGDVDAYRHDLAEYGLARELFFSVRENTPLSKAAVDYQNRPLAGNSWSLSAIVALIVAVGLIAFFNLLLLQIYREMDSSILEAMTSEPAQEPKAPDLIRSQPKDRSEQPELTQSQPKPVVAKHVPEGMLLNPDYVGPELYEPEDDSETESVQEQEPEPESDSARPDAIDPGFTLKF